MRAVELIAAKRAGEAHEAAAIRRLVDGYLRGEVPDYQMAAWLMAVCWRGLDAAETRALTLALADSGRRLSFRDFDVPVVDKHSTGGVGDKTTLVLAPMLAAAGVAVAKMSGRGLGHTGGTIDKLESIPGVRTALDPDRFVALVRADRLAIAAQSPDLAPADGQVYALRDVTATVESIPLIASSVMSKKIATGAQAVVLDVKAGSGAFMKDAGAARQLAQTMVALGRDVGLPAVAVISDMCEPLGNAVGNALEVREAIETLRGRGPDDLLALCLALGSQVMVAAGAAPSAAAAERRLRRTIDDGGALDRLRALVAGLGGDAACIDDPDQLPAAPRAVTVAAVRSGYVASIDALACGEAALRLGAGRATKDGTIDPAVGIVLHVKRGARVEQGDAIATVHLRDARAVDSAPPRAAGRPGTGGSDMLDQVQRAIRWSDAPVPPRTLILDVIR